MALGMRLEKCIVRSKHVRLGFVDDIDLSCALDHLPGAGKTPGNHEALANGHDLCIALGVRQNTYTFQNLAVLLFGVGDTPFALLALPDSG